ncbi:hypothetical protein AB833_28670 [Chromatiales bacterium (ex Bugula neritina AB1)]|nr:hypothetical protein AB833_28670 [Chromatiales bacterium (ex Bugula neritina AB1)]
MWKTYTQRVGDQGWSRDDDIRMSPVEKNMKLNIDENVKDVLSENSSVHLGKLLGQPVDSTRPLVEKAIDIVIDRFTTTAGESAGREVLYEAVRYCDDTVLDDRSFSSDDESPDDLRKVGLDCLGAAVGLSNKAGMVDQLATEASVSVEHAESVLGNVTPVILSALRKQISIGAVLDNPDGIGQMFLGDGLPEGVTVPRSVTSASGFATGVSADNNRDMTWLVRYALPMLLIGALVIGGVRDCGGRAAREVSIHMAIAEESALEKSRRDFRAAQSLVVSLQELLQISKEESARLDVRIDSLATELDATRTDLASTRVKLDMAREELSGAIAERDDVIEKNNRLAALLESLQQEQAGGR